MKVEAYTRQQDHKIKKVFQFRRIRGKTREPELPDQGRKDKNSKGKALPRTEEDKWKEGSSLWDGPIG